MVKEQVEAEAMEEDMAQVKEEVKVEVDLAPCSQKSKK